MNELITVISNNHCYQRLDQTLTKIFPQYSRSRIKQWILDQRVLVNGVIWNKPKKKILGGEIVIIHPPIEKEYFLPQKIPLDVMYEDNDIIIINKPCGIVVHPGAGNFAGTIFNALLYHYPPIVGVPRAGIVHRLDKDTTGLMVVAKNILAYTNLVKSLQLRKIGREYEAIVIGTITSDGTIKQPIKRHITQRTRMSVHPTGKIAITHYHIAEYFRVHTRLRLRLETGRTHQIRVHMSYITHPLVGDKLYGYRVHQHIPENASKELIATLRNFNRQALHATTLRFYHPISGIDMEWHSPIPQDMVKLISVMRNDLKEK